MTTNGWLSLLVGWGLAIAVPCVESEESFPTHTPTLQSIRNWTTDDGLPQNTVTSILQARDGYLWFGTLGGLVRFDGLQFTVFDENNTPGLKSSRIVRLFEDHQGRLWVGTETAGVLLIDHGRVSNWPISQGGFDRRLAAVCEAANGAIWFYTVDGQLWRYWQGRTNPFLIAQGRSSYTRTLMAEPDGPVWVGTFWQQAALGPVVDLGSLDAPIAQRLPMDRLDFLLASRAGGYWRLANDQVLKCRGATVERSLGAYRWNAYTTRVTSACEDAQGGLVVGTLGAGAFRYDLDGTVNRLSTREGLANDYVLSVYVDRDGTLWVGTDGGGLNRVTPLAFDTLAGAPSLAGKSVQSICGDARGGVWLGFNVNGVARWQGGTNVQWFGAAQGLPQPTVWSVFVDRGQTVWAGTSKEFNGGLFQLQDGRFQRLPEPAVLHGDIHAIYQDRQGHLWVGAQEGLAGWDGQQWQVFTTQEGLSANVIQAIVDDAAGNLWVGTSRGLNQRQAGKWTAYHQRDGLPGEQVTALYADAAGVVWVGTQGSGLGRLERGRWTRFGTREGLANNNVSYLVEDREGWLWLGSVGGVLRVRKQELNELAQGARSFVSCRAYGKADGLPTREYNGGSQPAAWLNADGQLWLPTTKGVVAVDPRQIKPNTNPPPVVIESVFIDGQLQNANALRTGFGPALTVPAGKEQLEIHYTSLNLAAADKSRFKYRLEQHETRWTDAQDSRVAHYSQLPPGQYRFQVQAGNEDGVWNTVGASLLITVATPLWRTGWFLSGFATALLGLIVGGVHYVSTQKIQRQLLRLAHQEALQKERARIAQDLHDQLGANLTGMALLSELVEGDKDNPNEVEVHARQISQTARETTRVLDEIVWAVNPSNDTLEGLLTYACKYAQEFLAVTGLRYRLEVPDQLPAASIAPEYRHNLFLTFKEALNNVAKHAAASAVIVRLRREPSRLILEIQDDGRGLGALDKQAAAARNGLRNMRKRMAAIGGAFDIGPAPGRGTLVRLTAPLPAG